VRGQTHSAAISYLYSSRDVALVSLAGAPFVQYVLDDHIPRGP